MSMNTAPVRALILVTAALFLLLPTASGGPPKKAEDLSPTDLSLEVAALQTLYQFQFTMEQLQALRKLAHEIAPMPEAREPIEVSKKFRKALLNLRTALVEAKDDERISKLQEELEELHEKEKADLNDGVELTEAAVERAPGLLPTLGARQVAAYVAGYGNEFPDPLEELLAAVDKVRGLDGAQWKELREQLSLEVGWLVAGLDTDKAAQVSDQVVQLLIQVRAHKEDEFTKERPELEKTAREIAGVDPLKVMRHVLEHALAELLSNPRLEAAITARLQ